MKFSALALLLRVHAAAAAAAAGPLNRSKMPPVESSVEDRQKKRAIHRVPGTAYLEG